MSPQSRTATQARGAVRRPVFLETLHEAQADLSTEQLESLLGEVDDAARRLRMDPSLSALQGYKERVRAFVREAVRLMYAVDENIGVDRGGNRTVAVVVRTIDARLEALTRECMDTQRATLDLAARLDEIRGLLFDLYM